MSHPEVPEGTPRPEGPDGGTSLTRSDLVRLRQALADGWRVPDVLLNEALFQIAGILAAPKISKRLKVSAARVLVQMTRLDQAAAILAGRQNGSITTEAQAIREFLLDEPPLPDAPPQGPNPGPGARGDAP